MNSALGSFAGFVNFVERSLIILAGLAIVFIVLDVLGGGDQ